MKNVLIADPYGQPKGTQENFFCFCCQIEIDGSNEKVPSFETIKHLAKNNHQDKLVAFWNDSGAFLLKDQIKKTKAKFCIGEPEYREFLVAIKKLDPGDPQFARPKVQDALPISTRALLKARVGDVVSIYDQKFITPAPIYDSSDYTTLTSDRGILQNPTGWHEGDRVWGGGIVKVRHWIPWPVDIDEEQDILIPPSSTSWNKDQKVDEEQEEDDKEVDSAPTPTQVQISNKIRTVQAFGESKFLICKFKYFFFRFNCSSSYTSWSWRRKCTYWSHSSMVVRFNWKLKRKHNDATRNNKTSPN